MPYRAVVITCSDRAAADIYEDRSGAVLREGLLAQGFEVDHPVVLPDEATLIRQAIIDAVDGGARVVLTTGGTGVGPRDVTVEATRPLLTYEVPGIAEQVRAAGLAATPLSSLSRGLAGIVDRGGLRAFVFNAPGSRGGARDALAVLAPVLTHIVDQLDGADHDMNRPASASAGRSR
ncbi:MAG: MogA/MoaB family molybdenum cofactor biosynthesis protein [Tessaracoccus sp.]|uniref:MogA/MoaB family molybdenum cofactor biosynthesis protein n=1 Tax=Tessaracoccus sp. TaxID=1971211 RepID=UPI001EBADBA5|nr:MogA/MoaB family molybdenum cofactor biosynthesis protein [Tessaracoccus sp.]MBK7822763.1 MogA/MoaB family molybdenum cofactor biosynthesis protein [Tessaracoccus sp.]